MIAYLFVVLYLVVDIVYVTMARPAYDRAVRGISGEGIPKGRTGVMGAAALAYGSMALGWLLLVVPAVRSLVSAGYATWQAGMIAGVVYGLALYGVFNGSLYAMFRGWNGRIFVQDLLWGVTWTTVLTTAYAIQNSRFNANNQKN